MEVSNRTARIAAGATAAIAAALVLTGIWSFGIWDPWELASADLARRLAAGEPPSPDGSLRVPPLGPWLVAQGFALFGIHEWSGRIPIAIAGLITIALAHRIVARFADPRAGAYAALITATSPLFLFNARQMMGAAPGFAASALVFLCAASLALQPVRTGAHGPPSARARALWLAGLIAACVLATQASGFLTGALPPLAAVAAVLLARGELAPALYAVDRHRWLVSLGLVTAAIVLGLHVALVVAANAEGYSAWIGGAPRGGNPPTFEVPLEQVFHAFAPWSALVPMAFGHALGSRDEAAPRAGQPEHEGSIRLALALWAVFGYAAETVFWSRFGTATYLPVVALAGLVALALRDVERTGRGSWAAGLVALLLAMLLLRDYRGYPAVPASGLGLEGLTVPDSFGPRGGWAVLFALFGLVALLGLSVDRDESFAAFVDDATLSRADWAQRVRKPWRVVLGVLLLGWPGALLRAQWRRSLASRAWLVFFGSLACACTVFGVLSFAFGDDRPYALLGALALYSGIASAVGWLALLALALVCKRRPQAGGPRQRLERIALWLAPLSVLASAVAIGCGVLANPLVSSLAVRIGKALTFLVPALMVVVAAGRALRFAWHRLGPWALLPVLAIGVGFGGYTSLRLQPLMSTHFSPREVYDAYNRFAASLPGPLGEYRVGGRAAAYYARGDVVELADQNAVLRFLASPQRVWLAFHADELAQLNRAYRRRSGRHLFVADANSTRVLLATNQPIEGRENQNYLAEAVLDEAPSPRHRVGCNFDHRIELLGYDLDLPAPRSVGPGQQFVVTWYWRVLGAVPGSYQVFLHVDGAGQRLNGDHEPVRGRYPVRLWDEGDVVVDRQELRVPANFPPGEYTFFIGFFAGETRLDIVSGPQDDVDRCRAGTLLVR